MQFLQKITLAGRVALIAFATLSTAWGEVKDNVSPRDRVNFLAAWTDKPEIFEPVDRVCAKVHGVGVEVTIGDLSFMLPPNWTVAALDERRGANSNLTVRTPGGDEIYLRFRRPFDSRMISIATELGNYMAEPQMYLSRFDTDLALLDDAYGTAAQDIDGSDTPEQRQKWAVIRVFRFGNPPISLRLAGHSAFGFVGFSRGHEDSEQSAPSDEENPDVKFVALELLSKDGVLRFDVLVGKRGGGLPRTAARELMEQLVASAVFVPVLE